MTDGARVTYRSVLANREFAALVVASGLSVLGDHLTRIAVAVLVYQRTGSAFAASATYALSYLTYLLGGPVLSALSDRYRRVGVMVVCDVLRAPLVLVLSVSGLPTWCIFVLLAIVGVLAPPFDSARAALQPDILDGDAYVVGNAVMNMVTQTAQVLGLIAGGALVALVSIRGALVLDAASFLVSAGLVLALIRERAPAQREHERSTLLQDTVEGIRLVSGHRQMRGLLVYALLGSAAIIAPEGLAVPVADALNKGPLAAGLLTASVPAGFIVGSFFVLRVQAHKRVSLLPGLALLGCVPLLLTPLAGNVTVIWLLWFVSGAGGSVNLIASSAYVQVCPREFRSRAYGVAQTALYVVQGAALLLAGALAVPFGPSGSVAVLAAVTLALLALTVRSHHVGSQENAVLVRSSHR